jgi:transcriptional regulator with XRE-family HTH domain
LVDPESVPSALRAAIAYRGAAYRGLAAEIGVNVQTLYRWARGERSMNIADAIRLTRALRLPPDYLILPPASEREAYRRLVDYDDAREVSGPQRPGDETSASEALIRARAQQLGLTGGASTSRPPTRDPQRPESGRR